MTMLRPGIASDVSLGKDRLLTEPARKSFSLPRGLADLDSVALLYVALPNLLFLSGWVVAPWGWLGASVLAACIFLAIRQGSGAGREAGPGHRWWLIFAVAAVWCVAGGIGHFVYGNIDLIVRDAVLVDLVREPWPVRYHLAGEDLLLRSAIGYFLPAALVGKLTSIRVADLTMLAWTILGVAITFAVILRDRPSRAACCVRLVVFVLFSGMDIIPTIVRNYPHEPGAMIEWWGRYISFQSQTTSLFWAPNHTMSVWIATAWLASQPLRTISINRALLFVILIPLSSPIAGLVFALLVTGVVIHRLASEPLAKVARQVLDLRFVVPAAICLLLVFPYLLAGSGEIRSGFLWNLPWVGEEFTARYIEFVLVEFLLIAIVLLIRRPRDPLLWLATASLLALPLYSFGPFNDLAMRGSIPGLEILAIRLGAWMGDWTRKPRSMNRRWGLRSAAVALFAVGAVTPFMEVARPFVRPSWPMNTRDSIIEASHGAAHYVTQDKGRWVQRFLDPVTRAPHARGADDH